MRLGPPRPLLFLALLGLVTAPSSYASIREDDRGWSAVNEDLRIRVLFSEEGVKLLPLPAGQPPWEWGITLNRSSGRPFLLAGDDRLEYLRGSLLEWFRNGANGIEHGLEIQGRGSPSMRFDFDISGSLIPKVSEDGRTVVFRDMTGAPILSSLDLHSVDAEGREVASRWEWIEHAEDSGPVLRLVLDASDRTFPLRVLERIAPPGKGSQSAAVGRPGAATAIASTPSNDLCAGAEEIPGAGPFPHLSSVVDLTDATTTGDPPGPSCQPGVSRSVWFTFTPAATAAYSISVCSDAPTATTAEDTVLAVYSSAAACTGLAEMSGGCDDDSCGPTALQSSIGNITLTAGTTYSIVVWSYGTAGPPPGAGAIQLRVDRLPPPGPVPDNDLCAGAEIIPAAGPFPWLSSITADIGGATTAGDPAAPSCQPNVSRSIWYAFTPAESARYTFSLCADAPTGSTVDDTVLALYTAAAACSGFLEMPGGCDDDSCAGEAAQSMLPGVSLTAGTRYYVLAWEYGTASPAAGNTSIQLRVGRVVPPSNDVCAAATDLPLNTPLTGTTVAAFDDTRLPSGPGCFAGIGQVPSTAAGRDVAYRFAAPDTGRYSFRVSGYDSAKNAVLYVASDCPAGGAPAEVSACLSSANRTPVFPEEVGCLPLAAGENVYVYVDEDTLTSGSPFTLEANRCSIEIEPNGTPDSAGEPACGTRGSIAPAGDADFFTLGIAEPGSRLFAMADGAAGNSSDFDLRVTTGADTLEYDDFNNDAPFGSSSPNVSGTRLPGVASYLRMSHYSAVAQAEPYRLYACVQPPASRATPEVEPDNTIASATEGANEYYSGALSGAGDVDIFSLSAVTGELIQIGLDLDPSRDNTPFNGSLALLDAAGTTLQLVNDPALSSSTVAGTGSLAATSPGSPGEAMTYRVRSTGLYYVKVAWSAGTPGDYLLSICHECRVGPATDVSVSQSDAPDPAPPGGSVIDSIIVRNLGAAPASVVTLRDELPAGAVLISALASQGVCTGSGSLVCHLGNLDPGAAVTVSVTVKAPAAPGLMTNAVRISTAVIDVTPGNDASVETTVVGTADGDGDGVPDAADCAPTDPAAWAVPGEAGGPVFPDPADTTRLQWSTPSAPGGTVVRFDLLRSTTAGNFLVPTCLATDTTFTSGTDPDVPGAVFYYLVRSRNTCGGNPGTRSDGTPRTAGSCP